MRVRYRALTVLLIVTTMSTAPAGAAGAGPSGDGIEVTAEPSTRLVDFQIIQVTGTGFEPFTPYEIFECRADAVDESGCDPENAYMADADGEGVVRFDFPVDARIYDQTGQEHDCRSVPFGCKIGIGLLDDLSLGGFADLDFDPEAPLAPIPTATVEPDSGLADQQVVTVQGANLVSLFETFVYQCVAGRPRSGNTCNFDQDVRGVAEADGTVTLDYQVAEMLRPTIDGEPFDCTSAPGACVIELAMGFSERPDRMVRAPLTFGTGTRPPGPPTTSPPSITPITTTAPTAPPSRTPSAAPAPPAPPVAAIPAFTG